MANTSVRRIVRVSFNRDSSLDESKVRKLKLKPKQKKVQKSKRPRKDHTVYDEIYESFLREKKKRENDEKQKKQAIRKKRLVSIESVKVSTPVQKKQLRNSKNIGLAFGISPIAQSTSVDLPQKFFDSLRRQRLLEMDQLEKKFETTVIRKAKELMAQYEAKKSLQTTENILKVKNVQHKSTSAEAKENRQDLIQFPIQVELASSQCNENSLPSQTLIYISSSDEYSASAIPVKLVPTSDELAPSQSNENSLPSPTKFYINSSDESSASIEQESFPPSIERTRELSRISIRKSERLERIACDKKKLSPPPVIPEMAAIVKKSVSIFLPHETKDLGHSEFTLKLAGDKKKVSPPPVIHKRAAIVKKSVSTFLPQETMDLSRLEVTLKPGKWRRSLIAWRQSVVQETKAIIQLPNLVKCEYTVHICLTIFASKFEHLCIDAPQSTLLIVSSPWKIKLEEIFVFVWKIA